MSRAATPRASAHAKRKLAVCASAELADHQHRIIPVLFKNERHSAIVLRHDGQVYAYLNQCVHMARRLDCVQDAVFDAEQGHLRCSMHGIVFDPTTGESLSVLCAGERLERLRSAEADGQIYLVDKRVTRQI